MKWMEARIFADQQAEEVVAQLLLDCGAQGVNIEGMEVEEPAPWDYLDESGIFKKPFSVSAYFSSNEDREAILKSIREKIAALKEMDLGIVLGSLELKTTEIDEDDWANAWKAYFKPIKVSDHLVIKPTWEKYITADDELVIELDPGMAFGTGSHETTRMCMQLLEEYVEPEKSVVIDVGCGSGVLSIAAALLGAKKVTALDFDPVAVTVSKENITLNKVGNIVSVHQSDLLKVLEPDEKADIVVANIIADIVIRLTDDVKGYIKKNGMFICSGIIDTRLDDVINALKGAGFRVIRIMEDGEWRAVACKYKS